jgi:hexosaminidase
MDMIPLPASLRNLPGEFHLTPETVISTDGANRWNADFLRSLLAGPTGFPLPIRSGEQAIDQTIQLRLTGGMETLGSEGYRLEIRPGKIEIEAAATAGVFYGIQSLRQLLPPEIENKAQTNVDWKMECHVIEDRPRFPWRGFMLDEGRHFQGKETVFLTLDLMALQKLNIFHWHLTEDQGWRIEIERYPRLTGVGSYRPGTSQSMLASKHDGLPHQGFYTRDEIREIVKYASERHITVVPEIEVPGHCTAALTAYPELSCTGGPFEVATRFGIFPDIYCPGKDTTFTFLTTVMDEVMGLFPSPYLHIGGDEAPKKRWKACPDCQRKMRDLGIEDEKALQYWFTDQVISYLKSRGRHAIGWNEILHEGLLKNTLVQYWRGNRKELIHAVRNENRAVIMSTYLDAYLDHSYELMPLSRAYHYEPIPAELGEDDVSNILGLEFPLWSEWVPNRDRLDYQVYPRLTAMAETGWTMRNRKDFNDFRKRLGVFLKRLDILGVRYASLKEAEPPKIRQALGIFSIARPQTKISR